MRKLIICLAIASVAVSCKKIQAGGNKNTLKLEEGVERYSDDAQGGGEAHGHEAAAGHKEAAPAEKHEAAAPKTDSTAAVKHAEAEKAPKAEH
ncbi:hypothetical protein CLU96_3072 [Chryseobacterium sp. 52]|uniref:hypothetical protein n=1 Tax=Chryseobacterium sp. 52 TaxID=2035213 RepID=UPI000C18B73B|nr:hypothetical protein [Chryseobacterium sp. 52]PIF46054.1 hypothetical protein CLU96_3072 [Chryseobacterium sp. 52]